MHEHCGFALGLQTVEHAQRARHLPGEHRFAELEHVVARDVEHRRLDLLETQLAGRIQQAELLDLLVRRQQVAFDTVSEERERLLPRLAGEHALALQREALRDPLRQRLALDRVDADRHTGRVERAEPGARLLLTIEPRQLQHGDDVVRQHLAIALQSLRAFLARLARRDADFDQLLVGEQAHRLRRAEQRAPVEVRAAGGMDLALGVAGGTRRGADRVARFLDQQRLVSPQRVERAQALLQMGVELVETKLHGQIACTAARRRITCATMSLCIARKSSVSSCSFASAAISL